MLNEKLSTGSEMKATLFAKEEKNKMGFTLFSNSFYYFPQTSIGSNQTVDRLFQTALQKSFYLV